MCSPGYRLPLTFLDSRESTFFTAPTTAAFAMGATAGTTSLPAVNFPRAYPPAARRSPPKTRGVEGPEGASGAGARAAGVWVAVRVAKDWAMAGWEKVRGGEERGWRGVSRVMYGSRSNQCE